MTQGLAVISGATGGIGLAVTEACWRAGYSILALGKTEAMCQKLTEWLLDHPMEEGTRQGYTLCLDLAQSYGLWQISRMLDTLPPVTLLVTCHGYPASPMDARYCSETVRKIWQCDVMGTVHLCEMVGRRMVDQRYGSIVLVSSAHARASYPQRAPYAIAKASICALARALAVEWGPSNVRVNSISPWQVSNSRSEAVAAQEYAESGIDTLELYRQRSPLRRLVAAEDIARTVLWLADSPSVSGADIAVDCGVGASMWHRPFVEGGASDSHA